jgi:short-subunit dehydrogenase
VSAVWAVAGIIHAGTVLEAPLEDVAAIVDVDFWGVVHTVRAFLPAVVAAGGAVVTVSSAFGLVSAPGYGGYNAAKFAVRGWTDALRQELRPAGAGVRVTCVYPGGVRTSIMARARSAAGPGDAERRRQVFETRVARMPPDRAAAIILRGVRAGRPRVLVGADARVADLLARVTGTGYERLVAVAARRRARS